MSLTEANFTSQPPKRYGMTVDVNRCVGCQTCTIACKHANDTPPGVQWRSVLDVEQGDYPDVQRFFLVVGCQHCADPPCVPVCPTGATAQREDGLVTMDHDLCIGCAYCAVACPYQARTIVHEDTHYFGTKTRQEEQTAHPERIGTVQKCTFCIDRIDEAEQSGLTPGEDLDVTPACAGSCIAEAIKFGDFNDPQSEVSRLARGRRTFQINDFLGTDPQIKYLYEVPGAIPEGVSQAKLARAQDQAELSPSSPLAGPLQTFWDYRAAMNFIMGGMGSGMIVATALAGLDGAIADNLIPQLFVFAGIIVAIGLLFVLMEIGRKERFWYALFRPQTSWMTREVWIVGALYPLIGANLIWSTPGLWLATGLAGAAFLFCQAQILFAGKGIPAWRTPLVPAMIIVTGLTEGTALALLAHGVVSTDPMPPSLILLAATLALGTMILWMTYVGSARRNGIPALARKVILAINEIVVMAWAAAIVVLIAGLIAVATSKFVLVGALLLVGAGTIWKFTIITRAAYQQGFVLPQAPGRGSGTWAAPARLDGYGRAA